MNTSLNAAATAATVAGPALAATLSPQRCRRAGLPGSLEEPRPTKTARAHGLGPRAGSVHHF